MIRAFLLLLVLAVAAPALAQETGGGGAAYVIGGIPVDTSAKTTYDARMAAYRIARAKAWPLLWNRLTGEAASSAPHYDDGTLQQMVAGIEIEGEHFSTTRYIATLGVVFDRARASAHFAGTAGALHSGPMLLLPVFTDAGARTLYQVKTPWISAWSRFSEGLSPIDYVIASGSAGDNVLLTSYQTQRSDRPLWRNILNRFGAVDVLIAEVRLTRSFPGGPIAASFVARHGPDGTVLGAFDLRTSAEAGLDAMLDQGVRRIDQVYADALRAGQLTSEADLTAELDPILSASPDIAGAAVDLSGASFEADVVTPDAKVWGELETALRNTPTVTAVTLSSLSLGGTSRIQIHYGDTLDVLRYRLDQRGLRLEGTQLRRKQPGDAPIPEPASLVAARLAAATGAVPPVEGAVPPAPAGAPPAPPPAEPRPALVPEPLAPRPRDRAPRPETRPQAQPQPAPKPKPQEGPVDLLSGTAPK
ncbi:heavy-metal-associated domain-containing protein [Sphingosinicellaceae bacterium]|nr:heavy-metal-associated domain-containing protein [Sphingosinicellaceae bacterium]